LERRGELEKRGAGEEGSWRSGELGWKSGALGLEIKPNQKSIPLSFPRRGLG
jgi:hypothetical protein